MPNHLVIQLARLGDLVQTLPAMSALQSCHPEDQIDLLCAAPLVSVGKFFPGVERVLPWDGTDWNTIARNDSFPVDKALSLAHKCMERYPMSRYTMAYNLNNHSRAIIAAHLFGNVVVGTGSRGPLSSQRPNWVNYLNFVGTYRGRNRVHLADALCGICGMKPPTTVPRLHMFETTGMPDLRGFGQGPGIRVALILGSGDADRRIPLTTWERWIHAFFLACPDGHLMLVGGPGERELSHTLLDRIPSVFLGRIWDRCGHTSLDQLIGLLSRCDWVVGSDTGPLHLGVACGAKAQGFYFSRARVHETGPYGQGHWVWQAESDPHQRVNGQGHTIREGVKPECWPIRESVELLLTEECAVLPAGWSLWRSQWDDWGAHFIQYANPNIETDEYRKQIWEQLSDSDGVDWDSVLELMSISPTSHTSHGWV